MRASRTTLNTFDDVRNDYKIQRKVHNDFKLQQTSQRDARSNTTINFNRRPTITLNAVEQAYGTTHRECLTVFWAFLLLILYLEGARFTIGNVQDGLRWIPTVTDATRTLARWRFTLC